MNNKEQTYENKLINNIFNNKTLTNQDIQNKNLTPEQIEVLIAQGKFLNQVTFYCKDIHEDPPYNDSSHIFNITELLSKNNDFKLNIIEWLTNISNCIYPDNGGIMQYFCSALKTFIRDDPNSLDVGREVFLNIKKELELRLISRLDSSYIANSFADVLLKTYDNLSKNFGAGLESINTKLSDIIESALKKNDIKENYANLFISASKDMNPKSKLAYISSVLGNLAKSDPECLDLYKNDLIKIKHKFEEYLPCSDIVDLFIYVLLCKNYNISPEYIDDILIDIRDIRYLKTKSDK